MEREQAIEELKTRIENEDMIKHSFAVEAIMRAFGRYFKDDEEKWAITGLLHDIDYEKTKDDPTKHGLVAEEILETLGADESIVYAIKAHNDANELERKRRLDKILYCSDPMYGLIVDCVMELPTRKIEDLEWESVITRINENTLPEGVNIEKIKACQQAGVELEEFVKISITAMKNVASDIGL